MAELFVICGHGAGDPGACGNGFREADQVRKLGKRIKALGGDAVLLGDVNRNYYKDKGILSLNIPKSCKIAELHMDSNSSASPKGAHVVIKSGFQADKYDKALANFLSGMFPGRSQTIVGRNNLANVNRAAQKGYNYRLLECGFISNPGDAKKFNDNLDELARGILSCFGIGASAAPAPSQPESNPTPAPSGSFTTKVTDPSLNIRKGPGTSYGITGVIKDKGTYTIVEVKNGWGRLKSGAGWINLSYTTYGGGKTSGSSSSSSTGDKLTVDGKGGTKTIKKAQKVFGTAVDGKISNQLSSCKKYIPGFVPSCIDWDGGSGGSVLVKAIQRWAGVTADGKWGKNTSIAVQKKLGVAADGIFGTNSMKAFQRWLNTK